MAVVSAVATIAMGIALAVVSSTSNSNTLATIALALAIVTFSAQLIIALAQGLSDSQQARRNEDLASKTSELLAELRGVSTGLVTTSKEHFDLMLKYIVKQGDSDTAVEKEEMVYVAPPPSSDLAETAERYATIRRLIENQSRYRLADSFDSQVDSTIESDVADAEPGKDSAEDSDE